VQDPRPVQAEPLACITQPALIAAGDNDCTARYIAAGPAITHAKDTSGSPAPAVSPGVRPLPALEPEAASRMDGRKWLRAFTGRNAAPPRLMTEAKEQVGTTVLCFGAAFGVPGPAHCYLPRRW
jgi:hypothetical protein